MTRAFALKFETRRGDFPKLTRRLFDLSENFPEAFRLALYEEAQKIIEQAKLYAPYRSGRLYRSGQAYWPGANDPRVNVQFLAPYALAVHETHPTKAKFLERALNEALTGMARRVARRIAELET